MKKVLSQAGSNIWTCWWMLTMSLDYVRHRLKTNHLQEIVSNHSHFSTQYSVTTLFAFPVIFSTSVLFTCWTSWMTILHKIGWIMIFSGSTHNTPEASTTLAVIIKIICRLWKAFWVNRGKNIFLSILLVIATVANGDTIVSWPSSESSFSV